VKQQAVGSILRCLRWTFQKSLVLAAIITVIALSFAITPASAAHAQSDDYGNSDTASYSEGYLEGSADGYNVGYNVGYYEGYLGGSADGYTVSYAVGYYEGSLELALTLLEAV